MFIGTSSIAASIFILIMSHVLCQKELSPKEQENLNKLFIGCVLAVVPMSAVLFILAILGPAWTFAVSVSPFVLLYIILRYHRKHPKSPSDIPTKLMLAGIINASLLCFALSALTYYIQVKANSYSPPTAVTNNMISGKIQSSKDYHNAELSYKQSVESGRLQYKMTIRTASMYYISSLSFSIILCIVMCFIFTKAAVSKPTIYFLAVCLYALSLGSELGAFALKIHNAKIDFQNVITDAEQLPEVLLFLLTPIDHRV